MQRRNALVTIAVVLSVVLLSLVVGSSDRGEAGAGASGEALAASAQAGADSLTAPGVPETVTEFLRNGQAWRAARALRDHLGRTTEPPPEAVLLAARAEAGWGGWDQARKYLEGRPWLDVVRGGEGWYWLARAREEDEAWEPALEAYGRYLATAGAPESEDRRRVARLRQGLILLRLGRAEEGARLLQGMHAQLPEIASRVDVLAAEALASAGDTAGVRGVVAGVREPALRDRGRLALVEAHVEARDPRGALALARAFRGEAAEARDRAAFALHAGRAARALGDPAAAREELRTALRESPPSPSARAAADLLVEMGGFTPELRLEVARVLDRHGQNNRAAVQYRALLAGGGAPAEVRQLLGQALFDAGQYAEAASVLRPLTTAEGQYLAARATFRAGNRPAAEQLFLRVADRFPGTATGAEALFMVADLAHDAGNTARARTLFRRLATDFRGTDRGGLALMRLGGMAYAERAFGPAAAAWEEYRSAHPTGERWSEATYWAARSYQRAGDAERAAGLYRAIRERDPISYYAVRSAERLDQPFWPVELADPPAANEAARGRVEQWMHGVDLLREAGLHDEAEQEADRWIARAGDDTALLYPLAEALNQRGYTVRGIQVGYRLRDLAGGAFNVRLLRIIYPFPYRPMVVAEAREKGLDPFLVAALIRQESLFKARIMSPVGARGLMQLMPETGQGLAAAVGIRNWDTELLYQPEINAHLGTRFLAEQMRRWNGSLPSVFSAYNAGPHRVQQWRRFPEYADEELFTERIPYRETRDYVKILTRNIALYRALYGDAPS